jgi:hypothetical protein
MKTKIFLVFLSCIASIGSISCSGDEVKKSTDPAAISSYAISNQTSEILIYAGENNVEISPSESSDIDLEAVMGAKEPMKPSAKFDSIVLYKNVNGSPMKVFEFNPVTNQEWNEEVISYNNSKFILTITNDMLVQ